jgi:hypothetical protein
MYFIKTLWWWAVCCSKHVEPSMKDGIINSITRLLLVGCFYWVILRCTNPWILNWQLYVGQPQDLTLKILHFAHKVYLCLQTNHYCKQSSSVSTRLKGWDRLVHLATRYGLKNMRFEIRWFCISAQIGLGCSPSLLYSGYGCPFPRVKQLGRGVDHLPSCSVELKN